MRGIKRIDILDSETGEFIYEDVELKEFMDSVSDKQKRSTQERLKCIVKKYNDNMEELTLEELELLMKVWKVSFNIKLDYRKYGYYSIKNDQVYSELNLKTLGFLFILGGNMSKEGRLVYKNSRAVRTFKDLREYCNISQNDWTRYISKDIDKYNLIKKETIDGNRYILVNPIYLFKDRKISETIFVAFYKELKTYLSDIEYLYLCKCYNINPEDK